MLETKDLILDRGRPSDWKDMYENVWSRPECSEYMFWELCGSEDEAKERMLRTVRLQEGNASDPRSARREGFTIYEKKSGKAIGFYNIEQRGPGVWGGMGLCIGADYLRRGYGTKALAAVLGYCRERLGARSFVYTACSGNEASIGLAKKLGFSLIGSEEVSDWRNGEPRTLLLFGKDLTDGGTRINADREVCKPDAEGRGSNGPETKPPDG